MPGQPSPLDLFIQQVFGLSNALSASTNREYIIGAGRRMLRVLRHYRPGNDDEQINIETAIDLSQELIEQAGGVP